MTGSRIGLGLGVWTSILLILLTLFIGSDSQVTEAPKFDWNLGKLSRTVCNDDGSPTQCFYAEPETECRNLKALIADVATTVTRKCKMLIAVEPPKAVIAVSDVDYVYTFRIAGEFVAKGKPSSRRVAIGIRRRTGSVEITGMDNSIVFACIHGRDQGKDILGLELRYTVGNTIRVLEKADEQQSRTVRNLKVMVENGRLQCEFQVNGKSFRIIRPPGVGTSRTAIFRLDTDSYDILAAHGTYDFSRKATEGMLSHGFEGQRRKWDFRLLRPNDCGRIKTCLGRGVDGCELLSHDCPISLRVEPKCGIVVCTISDRNKANRFTFELESRTADAVMVGIVDRETSNFRLADMGVIFSCERPTDGRPRVLVPRMNTCYGPNKVLTEAEEKKCMAVRLASGPSDTTAPILSHIRDVLFDFRGADPAKLNASWLLCSFVLDYMYGQSSVTLPGLNVTQILEFNNTKFYLAIGELNKSDFGPGVTGGYSSESLPIPSRLNMISTRLAEFLYGSRVDFILVKKPQVNDTRPPGIINPHDPNSTNQMASNVISILLASALAFILTRV